MKASKNPEYLRSVQAAVEHYKVALQAYLDAHVPTSSWLAASPPPSSPKRDRRTSRSRRWPRPSASSRTSGEGSSHTGLLHEVQGVGRVDPIAAWATMAQPKPVLEPRNILDACDQMIGRLGSD